MDNSKFLKIVIITLLVINLGTLAFMWFGNHHPLLPPHERGDAMTFLTHELKLTDDQQKQLEDLREEHREAMDEVNYRSHRLHDDYFDLLHSNPFDSAVVNRMADSLVASQKQIELLTFYHFRKVRALCTPEQQQRFDEVINDALRRMAPKPEGDREMRDMRHER